jgi:insertion element IS1 protein InsB
MKCQYCKGLAIKSGKQKSGVQKYYCKSCKKYQQEEYKYQACVIEKRQLVIPMIINNSGFAGISEVLGISYRTISKDIFSAAKKCKPPHIRPGKVFEVDEVLAYNKTGMPQIWAAYAIDVVTKQVIGINVGQNNMSMLRKTIDAVMMTDPKRIYCDGNSSYKSLIPKHIRRRKQFLKFVERLHLTVRNKLKMMNRETLAFVRKKETLLACLKLLFWWTPKSMAA